MAHEVNDLLSELRQNEQFQFAALALRNPDRKSVAGLSQSGEAPSLRDIPIPVSLEMTVNLHAIEVHDASDETRFPDLPLIPRLCRSAPKDMVTGVLILGQEFRRIHYRTRHPLR